MDVHKKILGGILIGFGVLELLLIAIGYAVFTNIIAHEIHGHDERMVTNLIFTLVTIYLVVISIPSIIVGIGLLMNQRWALVLALILGCISLVFFPIGTAIGVYAIVVFVMDQKERSEAQST